MQQLSVRMEDDLVIARVQGEPTEALLAECQQRVLELARESIRAGTGARVLYDALDMTPPSVEVTLYQRRLDQELESLRLKRAVVVPNSRLAYLARLAFGEGDYRVFYGDTTAAVDWLEQD